jgi:glyoxylase-like metal-dependent hydrolase (beta-lactamase superfamily II)
MLYLKGVSFSQLKRENVDLIEHAEVLQRGDDSGNEMLVRFRLPSGLEIFGLPTKNFYGGHWDLGPTWNYAVLSDRPFLVDAGRFGQGKKLVAMLEKIGITAADLDFVLISHGHEDHDGGLAELVDATCLNVKAHAIYGRLIKTYPAKSPSASKKDFPAKCWHCFMPETFYTQNCLEYHNVLQGLKIDPIGNGANEIGPDIRTAHLPGHSPDCLAVRLGDEAIIVGDIILPDISPWPTRKSLFNEVAAVIDPPYTDAAAIFGLRCYIRSLKKLIKIASDAPGLLVLPAHRFYYHGRWNPVDLENRANELLAHHIARCAAIIDILKNGPKTAEEIAAAHFEKDLLEGYGSIMAANEIVSHCELLIESGDVVAVNGNAYAATGSMQFETDIQEEI